ncbi:MAG: response regulator [Patescibacteria group bacterium]|nr:response regulator [Patescibacteria group bacterium]
MKPTILVVDDDMALTKLYSTALSSRGYRVLVAQNGEEGMAIAETERPDLILLDVMMPEIHGLHVLDILGSIDSLKDTKIIILTALSDVATKEKAVELGAYDFIVKSESSMAEIIDKVHRAVS